MNVSKLEKAVIRELQGNPEIRHDFYESMAGRLDITTDEILKCIQGLRDRGILMRIGAVVRHQLIGYKHNFIVALSVPPERTETAGEALASMEFITHCYEREVPEEFPFNIFAMAHASSPEEKSRIVQAITAAAEADDHQILESVREVKKVSMTYFK
ncbi:MAG: siroheme decarboxylase subunit beta [Planctomycetota bacterium]|jgi:DNA-binding Lrp family transcriptional regulator